MRWNALMLGILNVYAPNQTGSRVQFWSMLEPSLPEADMWCLGGDFNMIEDAADRTGGSMTTIQSSELGSWEHLCLSRGLHGSVSLLLDLRTPCSSPDLALLQIR